MASLPDILVELRHIRKLLLDPTACALRDCQRRLLEVIQAFGQTQDRHAQALEVKELVIDIRRLLESAKRFWDARQLKRGPGQRYSAGGALSRDALASTFVMEI